MIGDGNFISQVPLFGGLDDAQQVSLQQKMGHTTLRRGETLFDEGDLGDRLYIVTEGKVKLGHTSSDGRESLLAVLGPGEIIGELTLFDPGPRSTTATAVSPASLLYLEHEDLMHVLDTNPTLAKHMLRALAQRLRRTNIRGRIVSTVAGFRGAISLAMALSIPVSFDGAAYTERNLIILVVAGATLLSLLIQGLALPYVVRWANARPSAGTQTAECVESQETDALAEILADTISQLDAIAKRTGVDDDEAIEAVRLDYARRHQSVLNSATESEADVYCGPESALRLAVIEHLRERVHGLRFSGRIDDSTASRVNRRFDVETLHINGPLDVE